MLTLTRRVTAALPLCALLCLPLACGESVPLAPRADHLEESMPKTATAMEWSVAAPGSQVTFEMQAPFERQDGRVPESALSGTLHLDLHDLRNSTGLLAVDIGQLEIFMQKAEEAGTYGEREKSDLQNEHMRDWLEIGDDVPPAELEKNRLVQFSLQQVSDASVNDVTALAGPERTVTFTASGEVLLHQHKTHKTVRLEAVFEFDGDRPTGLRVRSLEPLTVGLAEHDVHPRTGFGTLAKKTLGALGDKVAEEAAVSVSFQATPAA